VQCCLQKVELPASDVYAAIDNKSHDLLTAAVSHDARFAPPYAEAFIKDDRAHKDAEPRERSFEPMIARENQIVGISRVTDIRRAS
jgi:hypothetical protein